MKSEITWDKIATLLAVLTLAGQALAQDPDASATSGVATEQPEPVSVDEIPATEDAASDDTPGEEPELISLDEIPDTEETGFDEEEEVFVVQPSEQESNLEELRRSFELYKTAVANGSYDEADTLAKRMVELTIRLFGIDSHEASSALTNLGRAQYKNHDYESAVLNFTASIEIIERIEDRLNSDLINPLRGLGAAQLGSGRPDLARQAFDRAVHVSHVNEGPHNLMQIQVLEELAETHLTMGNTKDALKIHQFIYNIEARNTDLNSEAIIPALERQADWTHRMRMHERERTTWRKIIDILEDSRGKSDLSLIPPLTGLGNSYLYVSDFELESYGGASVSSGDSYLKRAIRISIDNPDSNWQIQTKTLLELGDYYVVTNRSTKAHNVYVDTWELLTGDKERRQSRAVALEKPHILQDVHPPKYYNSPKESADDDPTREFDIGTIVIAYDITSRGSTRNIRVVDADPAGLDDMEYSVTRELRNMRHRPRMAEGKTVGTTDQLFTHNFFYRASDLPVVTEEPADETVAAEEE